MMGKRGCRGIRSNGTRRNLYGIHAKLGVPYFLCVNGQVVGPGSRGRPKDATAAAVAPVIVPGQQSQTINVVQPQRAVFQPVCRQVHKDLIALARLRIETEHIDIALVAQIREGRTRHGKGGGIIERIAVIVPPDNRRTPWNNYNSAMYAVGWQVVPLTLGRPVHDGGILVATHVIRFTRSPVLIRHGLAAGPFPHSLLGKIIEANPEALLSAVQGSQPCLMLGTDNRHQVTAPEFGERLAVFPGPRWSREVAVPGDRPDVQCALRAG